MTSPKTIPTHQVGEWQLNQLVAASRGKLADYMFLFFGGGMGTLAPTISYLHDYFYGSTAGTLPLLGLIQIVLFFVCLAVGIGFAIVNRGKTISAEAIVAEIKGNIAR